MTLGGALKANSSPSDTLIGVGLAFFVTLMFCMVPILVEVVNKGQPDSKKLTSDQIGCAPTHALLLFASDLVEKMILAAPTYQMAQSHSMGCDILWLRVGFMVWEVIASLGNVFWPMLAGR